MPDDKVLPPPHEEYFEMEAAKAFHYRWTDWLAESPILRAKMVAHEMIKGMRDSYNVEVRQAMIERGETPGPKAPPPWQSIREKFFR